MINVVSVVKINTSVKHYYSIIIIIIMRYFNRFWCIPFTAKQEVVLPDKVREWGSEWVRDDQLVKTPQCSSTHNWSCSNYRPWVQRLSPTLNQTKPADNLATAILMGRLSGSYLAAWWLLYARVGRSRRPTTQRRERQTRTRSQMQLHYSTAQPKHTSSLFTHRVPLREDPVTDRHLWVTPTNDVKKQKILEDGNRKGPDASPAAEHEVSTTYTS